jgi:hypothetical protein
MKRLALLGVAAVVIACDAAQAPTAPTARLFAPATPSAAVISNDHFEALTFAPNNCNGDVIMMQAKWHIISAATFDGAGGAHLKFHINVQGQGTEPVSGTIYVANETINDELNLSFGVEETSPVHYNLIAKGTAPNQVLEADFHITITPNGDVTSYHNNFRIMC